MQPVSNTYIKFIDISDNNGNVNHATIPSDIHMIISKATEGATIHDSTFPRNYQQTRQYGRIRGAYNFARPRTSSALDEANSYYAYVMANGGFQFPPILDIEDNGGKNKPELTQWIHDWCNRIQSLTGLKPVLYTYGAFASEYFETSLNIYDWWIADYGYLLFPPTINGKTTWKAWQYTENSSIPGIPGKVDESWFAGTLDDLKAYCDIKGGIELQTGDTGTQVKQLQEDLKLVLGLPDTFAIDGDYGSQTSAAVRSFQVQYNVKPVDGIAGSITMAALQKAVDAKKSAEAKKVAPAPKVETPAPTPTTPTVNTALASAQQQLKDVETEVQKVQAQLADTQSKLTAATSDLEAKQKEASALQDKITKALDALK